MDIEPDNLPLREIRHDPNIPPLQSSLDPNSTKENNELTISGTNLISSISSMSTNESATIRTSLSIKNYYLYNYLFCQEKDTNEYDAEYATEIYENLLEEEKNLAIRPLPHFIERQTEINPRMREILIDWIVDIHYKFKMKPKTLYLTIHLIDTYLSFKIIERCKFQLLGIAAFLISSKLEEVKPISVNDLVFLSDSAFSKDEVLEMESQLLKVTDFCLLVPLAFDFYENVSKILDFNEEQFYLGQFFMESFMLNPEFVKVPGSLMAVTCCYIVMKFFNKSGYEICYDTKLNSPHAPKRVIKNLARDICIFIDSIQDKKYTSKIKFSHPEFKNVGRFNCPEGH